MKGVWCLLCCDCCRKFNTIYSSAFFSSKIKGILKVSKSLLSATQPLMTSACSAKALIRFSRAFGSFWGVLHYFRDTFENTVKCWKYFRFRLTDFLFLTLHSDEVTPTNQSSPDDIDQLRLCARPDHVVPGDGRVNPDTTDRYDTTFDHSTNLSQWFLTQQIHIILLLINLQCYFISVYWTST